MPRLAEPLRAQIINRYKEGELCSDLAREFGVDRSSVYSLLQRRGVEIQSREYVFRTASKHALNQNVFDEINENSAYWLGFLMADGSICETTIALVLNDQDYWHLEKFRHFMEGTQKIIPTGNCANRYAFQSGYVVKRLASYGLKERKSFDAECSNDVSMNRHYWRGMIDGDGCIGVSFQRGKPKPRLELCGSKQSMQQFSYFIQEELNILLNVNQMKSIFRVNASGTVAKRIIKHLYDDCETFLDRKATKAYEISLL